MRRGENRSPSTIADVLATAVDVREDERGRVHAPASLQSWPGMVHGGGFVALLDTAGAMLATTRGPRRIEARLTSSIPIDTDLALEPHVGGEALRLDVLDNGQTIGSGVVSAAAWVAAEGTAPSSRGDGWPLPMSEQCLACGTLNPLGLQVGLRFDRDGVWAAWTPREPWRMADVWLHPALAPVLLDEVAWWLGALVMKEGGLTNRLDVTLYRPAEARFEESVVAAGRFDDVQPIDRRRTFWRTRTTLSSAEGLLLATASIVFRGGQDYSSRQLPYFRERTTAELFRRMFPNYAG